MMIAAFEALFQRLRRKPSLWLSLIAGLALMFTLRTYGVDLIVMKSTRMEPRVPKQARLFVQKSFWRLAPGDLVVFRRDGNPKKYVAEVAALEGPKDLILRMGHDEQERITKNRIWGKVVVILRPAPWCTSGGARRRFPAGSSIRWWTARRRRPAPGTARPQCRRPWTSSQPRQSRLALREADRDPYFLLRGCIFIKSMLWF